MTSGPTSNGPEPGIWIRVRLTILLLYILHKRMVILWQSYCSTCVKGGVLHNQTTSCVGCMRVKIVGGIYSNWLGLEGLGSVCM